MQNFLYIRLFLLTTFLAALCSFSQTAFAQPANDNCSNADVIVIPNNNLGFGTFVSPSADLSSATTQVGESFAPSIFVAGQNQKSVWFKFTIGSNRKLKVSLRQTQNNIAAGDVGFAVYAFNSCLPNNMDLSTKLSPIETFGNTAHPCVDSGTYLIQVSSKTSAFGSVFIELEVEPTGAQYDNAVEAYQFGVLNTPRSAVSYDVACHSKEDNENLCASTMVMTEGLKTSWHTFTTPNYFDFINFALSGSTFFTTPSEQHIIGYRIYQGDVRTAGINGLVPLLPCDTFSTNGANVSNKRFVCGTLFQPNTTYSLQLIFKKTFNGNIKLGILKGGTQASAGPIATTAIGANNQLGILPNGVTTRTDYFSCNTRHSTNSCGPTKPSTGVVFNGKTYNVSTYFTLNLPSASTLNIVASLASPSTPVCDSLLVRVFKDSVTGSCGSLSMSTLYDAFINNKLLACIPPGNYVIQVLGVAEDRPLTNAEIITSGEPTCMQASLGRAFNLSVQRTITVATQFDLDQAGAFNNINGGSPLTLNTLNNSIIDTFGCTSSVLPGNASCNIDSIYDRAIYRQFNLADSGILTVTGLGTSFTANNQNNLNAYELFSGNANTLATAQNTFAFPQRFTGLTSISACITQTTTYTKCMTPGSYTFVEYGNQNFAGRTSQPIFSLKQPASAYSNWANAQNMGDLVASVSPNGGVVNGIADTFTCDNNAISVGGMPPCLSYTKAIYREFFLSDSALLRIRVLDNSQNFQVFEGRISTSGPASLTQKWECSVDKTSANCEFFVPGWYTVVSYGIGSTYGVNTSSLPNHTGRPNNIEITVNFNCRGPRYNKPYSAAIDTTTNAPFQIGWNQAADTGAYPTTSVLYTLNREYFNCTVDTPFTYTGSCGDTSYTRIAYYVIDITNESYVNLIIPTSIFTKLYRGDIRTDSLAFATRTPISTCNNSAGKLEICNLMPGRYTLVIYVNTRCSNFSPQILVDKPGRSRFDFARNAYDFDVITPNNTFQWGKTGDINPIHPGRAPSSDIFFCNTGAYTSDPVNAACYTTVNPNIYAIPDSNKVIAMPNNITYARRNLWYTVAIDLPGKYTFRVNSKTPGKPQQMPFAIYKSDVTGPLTFDQVVAAGQVDSTLAQGLTLKATNLNPYCGGYTNEVTFNISPCDINGRARYYILVENFNNSGPFLNTRLNYQIEVGIKLDTTNTSASASYNYYANAANMGTLNVGTQQGPLGSYICATANTSYPSTLPACAQRTLWYKFSIPASVSGQASIRLLIDSVYHSQSNDFVLYRQTIANDSTAAGLVPVTTHASAGYQKTCVTEGNYVLVLTGCNRTNELVRPEILFDTLTGDFCYNAATVTVTGAGSFSNTLTVDCHTIGTDYGEFNTTLSCPSNGITQEYRSSWFKIYTQTTDTLDINISVTENLNANSNQVFYRMMTGNCNAMVEQGCIQGVLTQNTYLCILPNHEYYIQVFTPVNATPSTLTQGTVSLNVQSIIHEDTCAPVNACVVTANFSATVNCDSVTFQNFSSFGTSIIYSWDFGDNIGTSTAMNPSYRYPTSTTTQTYIAKLTVYNTDCNDSSIATFNVVVPARPDAYLGPDTVICNHSDSLTFDVTFPGATYSWSTAATTPSIKVGNPGYNTYHVTINYAGCTYSDTITVYKTSLATRPTIDSNLCIPQDTILLNALRTGPGTFTYLWNTTATTASINVTTPGSYYAIISDSLCSVTDSFRVIERNDTIAVSDTICFNELPYIWNGLTVSTFGANVATYTTANNFGCDSMVNLSLFLHPSDTTFLIDTICASALPYSFFGANLTASGNYTHYLTNAIGCDSVLRLSLTVNPTFLDTVSASICVNDSFNFNNTYYRTQGYHTQNYTSIYNCDSIKVLNLTVDPYLSRTQFDTICFNTTYTLPSNVIVSTAGIYSDTLSNTNSCDSIITTHLFIRSANNGVANIVICENDLPFSWNGLTLNAGGNNVASFTTSDRFNCDSTTTLNLTVNSVDTTLLTATICSNNSPYSFYGSNLTVSGTYFHTLNSTNNCDSIIRLELQINPSYIDTFNVTICSNDSFAYNNNTYRNAGFYTHSFTTTLNCDSIRVLNLAVTNIAVTIVNDTICYNDTYTLPSNTVVSSAGTYYDTLSVINQCDSVVVTQLFVHDSIGVQEYLVICENELPYIWNGITVNNGGANVATYLTNSSVGCDSFTFLNLTVNPTYNIVTYDTTCSNNLPYNFYGANLTASGLYSHTFTSTQSCDSVIQLNLQVNPAYSDTTDATICQGSLYQFHGLNYFTTGVYIHTYTSVDNCDSNKVLNLTVTQRSPLPLVTSPVGYCLGAPAAPLSATGVGILWYSSPVGGVGSSTAPIPNTSILGTQMYYVSQNSNGCESFRDSIEVRIGETIAPDFDIIPDTINCTKDTVLVNYTGASATGVTFVWNWGGANYVNNTHPNYFVSWNTQGSKIISVYTENNGCISPTVTKSIQIYPTLETPQIDVAKSYCLGEPIMLTLRNAYQDGTRYYWTYNGASINATTTYAPDNNSLGWQYYSLFVESVNGCFSEMLVDSFFVSDYPQFKLSANTVDICEQDTLILNVPATAGVQYEFGPSSYFPEGLPNLGNSAKYAFINKPGHVYAFATNEYGCEWKDSLYINTFACCDLFVPNAFSPNGDGMNDELELMATNLQTIQDFLIFNRYGEVIFTSISQNDTWDGTYKGQKVDIGVYHYYLVYTCSDGTKFTKKGQIHVLY